MFELYLSDVLERIRVTRELLALYTHRIIQQAGSTLSGVFTVVFVYQYYGNSLWAALAAFTAIYLGTALVTPISARLLEWYGTRNLIMLSLPCVAAGVWALYMVASAAQPFTTGVSIFIALVVLYKSLYWVPYHVDAAQLLNRSFLGMQFAVFESTADAAVAVMPLMGGVIVAFYGYGALFAASAMLFLISGIPLLWVTNRYEHYEWSYFETFHQLLLPRNRTLFLACVGDGITSGAEILVWPLLVFVLLNGEYVEFGAIATLTLLATFLLRFLTGRRYDRAGRRTVLPWGAWMEATGWVMRMFAATPGIIVVVNTYYGFSQAVNRTSVEATYYEQAADNGRYVDEFTALKEISLGIGRTITFAFVGVCAWFFGLYIGFAAGLLLAAVASLATMRLSQRLSLAYSE